MTVWTSSCNFLGSILEIVCHCFFSRSKRVPELGHLVGFLHKARLKFMFSWYLAWCLNHYTKLTLYNYGNVLGWIQAVRSPYLFVSEFQGCSQFLNLLWTEILLALKSAVQYLQLLLRESCACFGFPASWIFLLEFLGCRSQLWRRGLSVGTGGRVGGVKN